MTHQDVINQWPSLAAFAADLGVPSANVRMWRRRNSIPVSHFEAVVEAAAKRGFDGISYETLAKAQSVMRRAPAPQEAAA